MHAHCWKCKLHLNVVFDRDQFANVPVEGKPESSSGGALGKARDPFRRTWAESARLRLHGQKLKNRQMNVAALASQKNLLLGYVLWALTRWFKFI